MMHAWLDSLGGLLSDYVHSLTRVQKLNKNLNGFNFNQSIVDSQGRVINTWADIVNRANLGMEVMHERNAHNFLDTQLGFFDDRLFLCIVFFIRGGIMIEASLLLLHWQLLDDAQFRHHCARQRRLMLDDMTLSRRNAVWRDESALLSALAVLSGWRFASPQFQIKNNDRTIILGPCRSVWLSRFRSY